MLCCVAVALGAALGAGIAFFRSQSVGYYATSMGLNFAVAGGCYFGMCLQGCVSTPVGPCLAPCSQVVGAATREALAVSKVAPDTRFLSGISGALVGGVLTGVFGTYARLAFQLRCVLHNSAAWRFSRRPESYPRRPCMGLGVCGWSACRG